MKEDGKTPLVVVVTHGEGDTLYSVVDTSLPDREQPAVIKTFSGRRHGANARYLADDFTARESATKKGVVDWYAEARVIHEMHPSPETHAAMERAEAAVLREEAKQSLTHSTPSTRSTDDEHATHGR